MRARLQKLSSRSSTSTTAWGERIQLKYEVPWIVLHEDGETRSGMGSSLLGLKWRFFDAGEQGWRISTYPQVELRNPGSNSARRGLAAEGTTVLVPFEFERAFESFGVNFEVGREFSSREPDEWFGGVVIGHEWSEAVEGMIELHSEASESLSRLSLVANIGSRINLTKWAALLVSVVRELRNELDEPASVVGYLGWQFTF
jgi:hypothetical protein